MVASLVATFGCLGLTGAVAVAGTVGAGFLIGHSALAIMMPVAVVTLAWRYRRHRQPLALGAVAAAFAAAYVHLFGGTPDWTLALVLALSLFAAAADWLAIRKAGACQWRGRSGSPETEDQPNVAGDGRSDPRSASERPEQDVGAGAGHHEPADTFRSPSCRFRLSASTAQTYQH